MVTTKPAMKPLSRSVLRKLLFDDFQSASSQPQWRFMGQTWQQKDGQLIVKRPGAGLNAALMTGQAYPGTMILETLMRLDLLYPEASAPFGVGVAYPLAPGGQSVVLFGFVGTRRIDAVRDPKRNHLTELAFYEVSAHKRMRLGTEPLIYHDASVRVSTGTLVLRQAVSGRRAKPESKSVAAWHGGTGLDI